MRLPREAHSTDSTCLFDREGGLDLTTLLPPPKTFTH